MVAMSSLPASCPCSCTAAFSSVRCAFHTSQGDLLPANVQRSLNQLHLFGFSACWWRSHMGLWERLLDTLCLFHKLGTEWASCKEQLFL